MAGSADFVVADDQHEIVRDTDLARHLQAGADRRHITHAAVDAGSTIEGDVPAFSARKRCVFRLSSIGASVNFRLRALSCATAAASNSDGNGPIAS